MEIPVIILGAGGHARVLVNALRRTQRKILGFLTPDQTLWETSIDGVPVLGGDEYLSSFSPQEIHLVNGIGSVRRNPRRIEIFQHFKGHGFGFAKVIHPSAIIASDFQAGEGSQIMAGVIIQPGCQIGANVIVNTGTIIDHDCRIGDHVHLAPGVVLSGNVCIGVNSHLGTSVTVIQGIQIGQSVLIGAGAVVIADIAPGATAMGVPAREARK